MRMRTAASAMIVAMKPASPKLRIRSELENCKATKDSSRRRMGENAGWPDNQNRIAQGLDFAFAREQPVARGEGKLHAVGEADHHDERCHHVEEHIEAEIEPAERAERQQYRDQRRTSRDDHERNAAEKKNRDEAAGDEPDRIVD